MHKYLKINKKFHKKIIGFAVVLAVVGFFAIYTNVVRSSALHSMSGFAWGADLDSGTGGVGGLGWLSFNCTDVGCNNDYGVTIDAAGNLVGYAWSSNYGWSSSVDFQVFHLGLALNLLMQS